MIEKGLIPVYRLRQDLFKRGWSLNYTGDNSPSQCQYRLTIKARNLRGDTCMAEVVCSMDSTVDQLAAERWALNEIDRLTRGFE